MLIKRINLSALVEIMFILIAAFFYSCNNNYDEIHLNPQVGIPFFNAKISLTDFLNYESDSSFYLYEDEDQLMHFYFERNIDTTTAEVFFREIYRKDTAINYSIPLDFVDEFYEIKTDLDAKVPFDDSFDIYKLDSIRLDSCILMVELRADTNNFDTLSIEVPTFFDGMGNPVIFEFSSEDHHARKIFNLDKGSLNLKPARYSSGLVDLKLHLKFSKKGEIKIKTPELKMYLFDLKISSIHGRFGNRIDSKKDSVPFIDSIPYLQNESVSIDINDPEIYLYFRNGFNFPFAFEKLKIEAGNRHSKQLIRGLPPSIEVDASTNGKMGHGQEMFLPKTNIENVLGSFPDSLYFSGELQLNPGDKETINSITKDDSLFIGLKGDIPLDLRISELVYRRRLDSVNMNEILRDFIGGIKFNAVFKNNFPAIISAQLFFIDDTGKIISQAFEEPIWIQPNNTDGEQYFTTKLSNEFDDSLLDSIRKSKLMVELKFLTSHNERNGRVSFLSSQDICFKFNVFGKLNL